MDPLVTSVLPLVAWIMTAGAIFSSVMLGGILAYHWLRFAMNVSASFAALILYSIIAGALISGLVTSAIVI